MVRSRWLWVVLVAALLVAASYAAYHDLRRQMRYLHTDLATLRSEIASGEGPTASTASALRRDLEELGRWAALARRVAARWPAPKGWPWLAAHVRAAQNACVAADELATAAWWVALRLESAAANRGLISTAQGVPVLLDEDPLLAALEALPAQMPRLGRARQALLALEGELATAGGRLVRLAPVAHAGAWGLDAIPLAPLLAGEGARTYLVIVQNSDELRATGGFISAVVVVRLEGARPVAIEYLNSYDIAPQDAPHPEPPAPLREIMQAPMLVFRDGNWSPDFPASAEVLGALYQLDRGEPVAGIVALDTHAVQMLMAAWGPLSVPGYDITVAAENVVETAVGFWEEPVGAPSLQQRSTQFQDWLAHRKDFGGALLQAARARARDLTARQWADLAQAMESAVRGKHLLAWALDNPAAQRELARLGADGRVSTAAGDYLLVVDSNMGWNKADRRIERAIAYTVELGPTPQASACITYRHTGTTPLTRCEHRAQYLDSYDALTQQCYWDYVRVLAPAGSRLVSAEGLERPAEEGEEAGRVAFGGLVLVAPGQERQACFRYALPEMVATGSYALIVQKQAGTLAVPLTVRIVGLPPGSQLAPASKGAWALSPTGEALLRDDLAADREYTLRWAPGD